MKIYNDSVWHLFKYSRVLPPDRNQPDMVWRYRMTVYSVWPLFKYSWVLPPDRISQIWYEDIDWQYTVYDISLNIHECCHQIEISQIWYEDKEWQYYSVWPLFKYSWVLPPDTNQPDMVWRYRLAVYSVWHLFKYSWVLPPDRNQPDMVWR